MITTLYIVLSFPTLNSKLNSIFLNGLEKMVNQYNLKIINITLLLRLKKLTKINRNNYFFQSRRRKMKFRKSNELKKENKTFKIKLHLT